MILGIPDEIIIIISNTFSSELPGCQVEHNAINVSPDVTNW